MKKILTVLCMSATLALFSTSCSKDDEKVDDSFKTSELYGTWKHIQYGMYNTKTSKFGLEVSADADDLTFNSDGTGMFGNSDNFEWKIDSLPNHIYVSDYFFTVKKISNTEIILLEDMKYSDRVYDSADYVFGVHLRKVIED